MTASGSIVSSTTSASNWPASFELHCARKSSASRYRRAYFVTGPACTSMSNHSILICHATNRKNSRVVGAEAVVDDKPAVEHQRAAVDGFERVQVRRGRPHKQERIACNGDALASTVLEVRLLDLVVTALRPVLVSEINTFQLSCQTSYALQPVSVSSDCTCTPAAAICANTCSSTATSAMGHSCFAFTTIMRLPLTPRLSRVCTALSASLEAP